MWKIEDKQEVWNAVKEIQNEYRGIALEFPVDPFILATKLGIKVYLTTFKTNGNMSGGIRKNPSTEEFEIYVSRDDLATRQRFTVAHELGHFQLHRDDDKFKKGIVETVSFMHRDGTQSKEELQANEFAGCLLMPTEEVQKKRQEGLSVDDLAKYFGVSISAMTYRLWKLGLVSE